jgi:ATP-binding cassette subfamily B protein
MNPLRRVLPYATRHRAGIVVGLVLVAVSNLAGVAMPWLIGRAIDLLDATGVTLAAIAGYAGLIVGATAVSGAARFGMRKLLNSVSRRIENDLREDVFEHLLRLDARFYGRMPTGELMSRLTNDTQAVRMAIGPGVMYMVNTLVLGVLAVAVMVSYDLRLTLLSLIPLVFLGPVMGYFGRVIHRRFERIQKHFGVLSTMVQENLSGVRIVRAYTQESAQEAEFDLLNREYFDRNMSLARTSAMFHPLLAILAGLGVLAVLWFGSLDVMAGRISAGGFVAFFFYLALLIWPMIAIGWVVNLFQRGAASMSRIAEILDADPAIVEPGEPAAVTTIEGDIEFRDVWFRYPGTDRDVLCGVTFRIPAGATAAIVGPTGAGKSTIIALMTRRYDPTRGQVLLDGTPLDRIPLDTLRAAVGLVPQDAFVFSETIADNIALGLPPGAGRDGRIEAAARVAQLDEAIAVFPLGFETRLGERGVNLSGGQRQRTTLARALARNAPVLILDDSLSAVDTHTETAILEGLGTVFTGRTAVVVSHRVSAVMNADTILVLEDGRIVEQGLHADLVAAGGLYATLLRRQLLAEGLEAEPVAADSNGTLRSL